MEKNMRAQEIAATVRLTCLLIAMAFISTGCGGGGGGSGGGSGSAADSSTPTASPTPMGDVVVFLTGAPADNFSAINLSVSEATLFGYAGEQAIIAGRQEINLLDLRNFNEAIAFGSVNAGSYLGIRLRVVDVELVHQTTGVSTFVDLPGDGIIELVNADGFAVFPDSTLVAEIDIDAAKSVVAVRSGESEFDFRPIASMAVSDGGTSEKLVRLSGVVTEVSDRSANRMVLCNADMPELCVVIEATNGAGVFDSTGLPASFDQ